MVRYYLFLAAHTAAAASLLLRCLLDAGSASHEDAAQAEELLSLLKDFSAPSGNWEVHRWDNFLDHLIDADFLLADFLYESRPESRLAVSFLKDRYPDYEEVVNGMVDLTATLKESAAWN